jgi:hypothetical protein
MESISKLYSTEMAQKVANEAQQLFYGYCYGVINLYCQKKSELYEKKFKEW